MAGSSSRRTDAWLLRTPPALAASRGAQSGFSPGEKADLVRYRWDEKPQCFDRNCIYSQLRTNYGPNESAKRRTTRPLRYLKELSQ